MCGCSSASGQNKCRGSPDLPSTSPPTIDASQPTTQSVNPYTIHNAHSPAKVPCHHLCFARFFSGAVLAAFFWGCAGQVPPGGGPVDTIPPRIIRTMPDTNSVRVSVHSITLGFSEYVNRRSVEESIFISPYVGELEFEWDGKEVTARFSEPLKENTTYVVNVGTDVTDMQAGNRMAAGYTLAFSTGDSIDRGFVSGRVFDEKPEGVMVFAYRLNGIRPDTLDPSHTRPDYITQTGRNGVFALSHLSLGAYRVIAVRDEYRDLTYQRQLDQYGVTTGDILLRPGRPGIADVWFRLAKEDTSRPFLAGVRARDRYRIGIRFSEPIDSASFARASVRVVDTLNGTSVPVALLYQERLQPAQAGILLAAPLDSPATYRVRVRGVADMSGNLIDSAAPGDLLAGVLVPDTLRPHIGLRDLRDSARAVVIEPTLELLFTDPVAQAPLGKGVRLLDSVRAQVDCRLVWTGPASIALVPRRPLFSRAWYALTVTMDSLRSLRGLGYRDSTYRLRFQTMDLRATGVLAGSVEDTTGKEGKGRVFVTAASVDLNPPRSVTLVLDRPGSFTFPILPEGKYGISGFRDADSSGNYSPGLPFPFVPSERFAVYPDTIRVRARWTVEGAILRFK